jgi:hypothetical protein
LWKEAILLRNAALAFIFEKKGKESDFEKNAQGR